MKHKFKFNDSMLLKLALDQLKTNKVEFQKSLHRTLQLDNAEFVTVTKTPTNSTYLEQPCIANEQIYATPVCFVKTTKYLRVKNVEYKQTKVRKPKVVYKKSRRLINEKGR